MKRELRRKFYGCLMAAGVLLLVLSTSALVRAGCAATPPRGCMWEVLDTYCEHVIYCSNGTSSCIDNLPGQVGCCYVEIGSIIEGGACRAQGCTTFKRCLMGTCGHYN
jgi:hypothetical protein